MANKAFEIQGSTLRIGGLDLQAGTTSIVIPGVTQATSYSVEEIEDTPYDQTTVFESIPTVIDGAQFAFLSGSYNSYVSFVPAVYQVEELDNEGFIDEIDVTSGGNYDDLGKNFASGSMYATEVADAIANFNAGDWVMIPFSLKFRARDIENVGGGGSGNQLVETENDNTFALMDTGDVVFDGEGPGGGVNCGIVWQYGDDLGGVNSQVRQDEGGLTVRAWTEVGDGTYSAPVNIVTGQGQSSNEWIFDGEGGLSFPDGTRQTTAYTGQTDGGGNSSSGELYIMANVDGNIVTSTNGIDWTDPQPSGMSGIGRVEIHGGVIVYIDNGGEGPSAPGLYYSTQLGAVTLCAGTSVSVETGNSLYWNEVHYFSGTDKWVAVGYNQGDNNNVPVLAHSDDGITWTVVFVDNTFVSGFNTGSDDWELRDVAWIDETNQYIITSALNGELFGGIFLTADITTALDGDNHVAIDLDAGHVAPWSVTAYGGPPGYVAIIPDDNDGPGGGLTAWFGYGTDVENYQEDPSGFLAGAITDQIGYMPNITEVAYRNGNFIAVTNDGQVITPVVSMMPEFAVTIPVPFTNTSFTITNANPAVVTWNGEEAKNNEKIEVTLAGEYNGTYYVNTGTDVLYTDQAMTTALDASGFAAFTSGTITFSHGMFFDAAGVSTSYYYIGNDDEQIFRSSNGINWTEQADFTGEYFNDFAYGSWGSASSTAIPNTKRGWINLVGDRPNNEDPAWFESVVIHGGYAYVLGGDDYIDNSSERSKVYKFDAATGEQVWVKQITAGRGAYLDLTVDAGVVTLDRVVITGTGYKVGEEIVIRGSQINGIEPQNNFTLIVASIDVDGGVATVSLKPGYNVVGLSGTFTNIVSYYDDARGDACAIAYDEYNQKLVVVTQYQSGSGDVMDNTWDWVNVYTMNPTTGAIESTTTISEDGDVYANSITTHNSAGGIAIVGEKYNEYREFGALTIAATYNTYFDILKTELDAEHYPGAPFNDYSDFWITGTGITGQTQVGNVNYYADIATIVREGSGTPQFQIADNGDGTYGIGTVTTADSANYRVGHKIKVLGTDLGGVTPDNDCIVRVTEVDSGGITNATIDSGTAAGSVYTLYAPVTGTNYNVGSGASFIATIDPSTGAFSYSGINSQGSNYVVGDVLTIPGTTFAGGTSPANDATLVVAAADVFGLIGEIVNYAITGTGPTNTVRIHVEGVDFTTVGGSWSMRQNLGGEAFIWTPDWSNAIGGPSGDRFYDVCWEDAGTALYAVGRGRYETAYDQALVVKFNNSTGAVMWSKDIKFSQAASNSRQARAVCLVPGSTDILVAGGWYNNNTEEDEIILTRMTDAGEAVWQKTYSPNFEGNTFGVDFEISIKPIGSNLVVSFEQTTNDSRGLAYMIVDSSGQVVRHRVVSSDGNSNYNYYDTPTANFADVYTDENSDQYVVMAGKTYVPTDNYYNALLMKLPLDGLKDIAIGERWSIGEHIMNRHAINVTTVTSAFDSFTPTEHVDTMTNTLNARNYTTRTPDGLLNVWTHKITDDAAGYLEFGDGSKQSFATNIIPQILAANDYWLTTQDSGKHIFFEHETGNVYIPHSSVRYFPVGFTFTIVNITGNDCYLTSQGGDWTMGIFKLAGRNISTSYVGIPDSGSGSMVTVMKIKDGYTMANSDNDATYPDIWMVSGPGDVYNAD